MEKKITKECPQWSCCGTGLWNIEFDSLINLQYAKHIKAKAFAEDFY